MCGISNQRCEFSSTKHCAKNEHKWKENEVSKEKKFKSVLGYRTMVCKQL
jgi:hypothetical protein